MKYKKILVKIKPFVSITIKNVLLIKAWENSIHVINTILTSRYLEQASKNLIANVIKAG